MRFFSFFIAISAVGISFGVYVHAASKISRILHLGDSLSIGAFGKTLNHSMRSSGFLAHTVVAGGASPYCWRKNYQVHPCTIGFWEKSPSAERLLGYVMAVPKLEDLIAGHKPNVVVVQTGINLYATLRSKRRTKEENVAEVRSLIGQISYAIAKAGATSYWVLPPHSHEKKCTSDTKREIGTEMALTIVPLSSYKTLSTWQMVDDLRINGELSIYTPKLD